MTITANEALDPLGELAAQSQGQRAQQQPYHSDPQIQSLGSAFYEPVSAARFTQPVLRFRNQRAARAVGLSDLSQAQWQAHFAHFEPLQGNLPQPLALRYHGHQFGQYNPQLGDGRGFLFAQLRDQQQRLQDLGTKGSGQTPYSRQGDGRLTLKGAVRELIAAELLEALGVDTCRILSIFETEQALMRHDEPSPTRSAVMVRQSFGHIRIGTFQYLAYNYHQLGQEQQATEAMAALVAYCLNHFYTIEGQDMTPAQQAAVLLERVNQRCAQLLAAWMAAGFVHGVLNSDNINVSGQSFDYGPYRFLPHFEPAYTAAYFDHAGRYAYARQPQAMAWNLGHLAWCLTLLGLDQQQAEHASKDFSDHFQRAFERRFFARLGYACQNSAQDQQLMLLGLEALKQSKYSWDGFFNSILYAQEAQLPADFEPFLTALKDYQRLSAHQDFIAANPPQLSTDHQHSESLWTAIDQQDNWQPLYDYVRDIRAYGQALQPLFRQAGVI